MEHFSVFLPYISLSVTLTGLYYLFENRLTQPWMRWAWWLGSACVVVLFSWQVGTESMWADFYNGYYFGGRNIVRDPGQLFVNGMCNGYVNFPLLAYLFAPFSFILKQEGGRIFFILNMISILPLSYWLVKFANLNGWKRWLALALLAVNGPLSYSIWLGNITHLMMLGMIAALWWFKQGKEWLTGVLLGFNGLIKIPLIIPAGYFFIRGRWRVVLGGLLVVGAVTLVSLVIVPFSLNRAWLNNCILSYSGNPVVAYNNQSAVGMLSRELIPRSNVFYWLPMKPTHRFTLASRNTMFLLYLPVIILFLYGWKKQRNAADHMLEFFIVLACSLLTSPISWTHYFMLLLVPFAVYLGENIFTRQKAVPAILMAIGMLLLASPLELSLLLFQQTGQRMFLSIHFWGGVVFYLALLMLWVYRQLDKRNTEQ